MVRLRPLVLAIVSFALLGDAVQAAFIPIDNFGNPNPGVFYRITPPGGGPSTISFTHATGLGSTRNTTFTVDAPSPPAVNELTGTLGFEPAFSHGVLDFNSSSF